MLFSPDHCIPDADVVQRVTPTTFNILGTPQFLEAKNSDYQGYDLDDLRASAYGILQTQLYMLYTWCITRFCLKHKVKASLIDPRYFNLKPSCFIPSQEEIQLYIFQPKFLWRFSMKNYAFFARNFDDIELPHFRSQLSTYLEDDSPMMPYLKPYHTELKNRLISKMKRDVPERTRFHKFNVTQIYDFLGKNFPHQLDRYDHCEIYYSDDFYLHQMSGSVAYDEFMALLLTGQNGMSPGQLLQDQIDAANVKKIAKKNLKASMKATMKESIKRNKRERNLPNTPIQTAFGSADSCNASYRSSLRNVRSLFTRNSAKEVEKEITQGNNATTKVSTNTKSTASLARFKRHAPKPIVREIHYKVEDDEGYPKSAIDYIGSKPGVKSDELMFAIRGIVARNSRLVEIYNTAYNNLEWSDHIVSRMSSQNREFYNLALKCFGGVCDISNYRFEKDGTYYRIGWSLPCKERESQKILRKFHRRIRNKETYNFSNLMKVVCRNALLRDLKTQPHAAMKDKLIGSNIENLTKKVSFEVNTNNIRLFIEKEIVPKKSRVVPSRSLARVYQYYYDSIVIDMLDVSKDEHTLCSSMRSSFINTVTTTTAQVDVAIDNSFIPLASCVTSLDANALDGVDICTNDTADADSSSNINNADDTADSFVDSVTSCDVTACAHDIDNTGDALEATHANLNFNDSVGAIPVEVFSLNSIPSLEAEPEVISSATATKSPTVSMTSEEDAHNRELSKFAENARLFDSDAAVFHTLEYVTEFPIVEDDFDDDADAFVLSKPSENAQHIETTATVLQTSKYVHADVPPHTFTKTPTISHVIHDDAHDIALTRFAENVQLFDTGATAFHTSKLSSISISDDCLLHECSSNTIDNYENLPTTNSNELLNGDQKNKRNASLTIISGLTNLRTGQLPELKGDYSNLSLHSFDNSQNACSNRENSIDAIHNPWTSLNATNFSQSIKPVENTIISLRTPVESFCTKKISIISNDLKPTNEVEYSPLLNFVPCHREDKDSSRNASRGDSQNECRSDAISDLNDSTESLEAKSLPESVIAFLNTYDYD